MILIRESKHLDREFWCVFFNESCWTISSRTYTKYEKHPEGPCSFTQSAMTRPVQPRYCLSPVEGVSQKNILLCCCLFIFLFAKPLWSCCSWYLALQIKLFNSRTHWLSWYEAYSSAMMSDNKSKPKRVALKTLFNFFYMLESRLESYKWSKEKMTKEWFNHNDMLNKRHLTRPCEL